MAKRIADLDDHISKKMRSEDSIIFEQQQFMLQGAINTSLYQKRMLEEKEKEIKICKEKLKAAKINNINRLTIQDIGPFWNEKFDKLQIANPSNVQKLIERYGGEIDITFQPRELNILGYPSNSSYAQFIEGIEIAKLLVKEASERCYPLRQSNIQEASDAKHIKLYCTSRDGIYRKNRVASLPLCS